MISESVGFWGSMFFSSRSSTSARPDAPRGWRFAANAKRGRLFGGIQQAASLHPGDAAIGPAGVGEIAVPFLERQAQAVASFLVNVHLGGDAVLLEREIEQHAVLGAHARILAG